MVRKAYSNAKAVDPDGSSRILIVGSEYVVLVFGLDRRGLVDQVFLGAPAE